VTLLGGGSDREVMGVQTMEPSVRVDEGLGD
jgi:hypothetical protein